MERIPLCQRVQSVLSVVKEISTADRHVLSWNMESRDTLAAEQGPGQKAQTLCRDCCGVSLKALFLILGLHLWVLQGKRCGQTLYHIWVLATRLMNWEYVHESVSSPASQPDRYGLEWNSVVRFAFFAQHEYCYQMLPGWAIELKLTFSKARGPCQTLFPLSPVPCPRSPVPLKNWP